MSLPVVVGIDGSERSAAAARWAAHEAHRRGAGLRMVHVSEARGEVPGREEHGTVDRLPQFALRLRDRMAAALPALEIRCQQIPGQAHYALAAAGEQGALLVLGSRGLGAVAGLLTGSVGLRAAAHARCPVVLVPAGSTGAGTGAGEVLVGVSRRRPGDAVLGFAFEEAARRGAVLRVLEGWTAPPGPYATRAPVSRAEIRPSFAAAELLRLQDGLGRWREKFPEVRTEVELVDGDAAAALLAAAQRADLLVLGRSGPAHPLAAPRLGPIAHAVLHRAPCPVALVPHTA
ncbi:universal stress protein [Kitasatospora nipponensis]|uniref:Universal stress protein n=1 Tax=Kitasatospora nipponensis TaxID=258049 RepID=A0ABN1VYP2_9ACTN